MSVCYYFFLTGISKQMKEVTFEISVPSCDSWQHSLGETKEELC